MLVECCVHSIYGVKIAGGKPRFDWSWGMYLNSDWWRAKMWVYMCLYSLVLRSDSCAMCVIHVTCRPGHPWFSSTLVLMADALLWWRWNLMDYRCSLQWCLSGVYCTVWKLCIPMYMYSLDWVIGSSIIWFLYHKFSGCGRWFTTWFYLE